MKKTNHLFRARWLLLAMTLLGVLGASAQDTWYLFDSYLYDGEARATIANPDADGNYVFKFAPSGCRDYNFTFVNSPNPTTDQETATFIGSATGNVAVSAPAEYALGPSSYADGYGVRNVIVIEDEWLVTFNPTTMKVKFEYAMPATLYLCDYQKSFASAEPDANGVYRFQNFVVTDETYPHYGFTDSAQPGNARLVLGTVPYADATADNNLVVAGTGASGVWEFSHYECINQEVGSYEIPAGIAFDCELNWYDKTVVFTPAGGSGPINPDDPIEAPSTLYLVDYTKSFGQAANDGNGVFEFEGVTVDANQYPYYGFANNPMPKNATIILAAAAADEATKENNINVELGQEYPVAISDWASIDAMVGSFVIDPGVYNIRLDWDAKTVIFSEYSMPAPEKLYLVDFEKSFGHAENDGDGVFVFKSVEVGSNQYPYYGFANASNPRTASLILAAASAAEASGANNVTVEKGEEYPVAISDWASIDGMVGSFIINPGLYDIRIDWNAKTVTFTEPVIEAPEVLYIIDYQTSFGSAINNGEGVYEFEDIVLTSGYPYYGFAPSETPNAAAWAIGTVDYATASAGGAHAYNIEVEYGEEYTFAFTSPQAMYDEIGSFVLGSNPVNITLDWNKGTVVFSAKPPEPLDQPARLYATDTYLDDQLGVCSNNGQGLYSIVVDVEKSSSIVVFTNDADFKNANGETIYYGTPNDRVSNVEFETEYDLVVTDYATVWGDATGLVLKQGRYKVDLDFVAAKIVVHDIARGDVWTIPETLGMYTDEMEQVAMAEEVEEGVFEFGNVVLDKPANVVFTDNPTSSGKFFGSSMKGDRSIEVKNFRTYDLYIPTYQEVYIDGLAGFMLPAGTWSVKVDMNEKNVSFSDPAAVYYPEQLDAVVNGDATSNQAEGNGYYIWKLTLAQESTLTFADPLTGRVYGSAAEVAIEPGVEYPASELAADALQAFTVPAGTWEVVLDLAKGTIIFYEYQVITLVDSTMKDGDKFYSYFGAGTDPVMTLTFSGNPYTIASAYLAIGSYVPGQTQSTDTCTIEKLQVYRAGNTLFTSFAGQARTLPEGAQPKATVVINTIKSVHGLLIDTEAIEGLPAGSLMFTFDFEEFQPIAIESKLLNAEGEAVETLNVDEMEDITLMVKPYSLITFDGVTLTAGKESVSLNWEAGEEDADGYTPIVATVPMVLRGTGAWTLALDNLNADDNTGSHGDEVSYAIESLVHPASVVTADPENGSTVDVLRDITLTWGHSLVKSAGYAGAAEPVIEVTNASGETCAATLMVLSTLDDNQMVIHIDSEIVEAGTYTVTIPAGTIILNDEMDTNAGAIELQYEVSGVNSIASILADPDAELNICTVSGIQLRQGRAADVLKGLRPGIYIINGVKTHIR